MNINIQDRTLIASLSGEIDFHQADRLRGQIDAAFEKSSCRNIILNMAEVTFMDSSGIGMVIGRYKNTEKRGGKLILTAMDERLAKLFEISGLSKIVSKTDTVESALKMIGGNQSE